MRIGLTYDLRSDYLAAGYSELETAEFDRDDTLEAIIEALRRLGHRPEPIGNVTALAASLVAGQRWDLVFNIAEGLYGLGREAQVPALLDAYRIAYTFSDPLTCALALHKGMAKRVVQSHGLPTPAFALVETIEDIDTLKFALPLFAKPVAEGTSKGITGASRIDTRSQLDSVCCALLAAYHQPVLVEAFLPGREFTVGILGTGRTAHCLGILEVVLQQGAEPEVYSYYNKEYCETLVRYRLLEESALARELEALALTAWRALGCRDAGRVDVRLDAQGRPHFLEINPLAGLHPAHSDLPIMGNLKGMPYLTLIEEILRSAFMRLDMEPARVQPAA